ncbi:hypothetical protein [Corynebacterium atypicum]|uniref:hypothetical protein n=1 Tax=Corynebacterium atypicum TaxID=191610 RepID=UPI000ADEEAAB|nr:hypothetical protein [Corynebacterium atypicum]
MIRHKGGQPRTSGGQAKLPGGKHPRRGSRYGLRNRALRLDRSELPGDTQDHWLDTVSEPEDHPTGVRTWVHSWFSVPAYYLRRIGSYVLTTPGRMITLTITLAVAIFAAGYSMSQSSATRQENLDKLLTVTEPTNFAAHDLYTQLSLADTVTATSLVRSGAQQDREARSYHSAIDAASLAASEVAAGIAEDDVVAAELITTIQRELPVYTGLVETARANSRQGNPVAVSYAATASALLRDEVLPAAEDLFEHTSTQVAEAQADVTRPQFVPLSGLFAAVFFLLLAQLWLWRKTRRRFNRGFLAATALMVIAILWVSVSNWATWQAGYRGFDQAARPWDLLTTARIEAQQSRTAETMALVRRQPLGAGTDPFEATTRQVRAALDASAAASPAPSTPGAGASADLIAEANEALDQWIRAHEKLTLALDSGDFAESERLTTDTTMRHGDTPTTATAFARLDRALTGLISESRAVMRSFIADGLAATTLIAAAVLLLSLGAVIAIVVGIRPRFQEYL